MLMRWFKSIGCVSLALSAAINPAPAFARSGIDASQLQVVALDTTANCNRRFFKSAQHYDNTIFVVPRVVAGAGPQGKRTYDPVWLEDEKMWALTLRIYFPTSSEDLKVYGASMQTRDLEACNLDTVKWSINSRLSDKVRKEQEVRTISPIPLNSIEVRLPDVADVGYLGLVEKEGKLVQDVDDITYYGRPLEVLMKLTAAEKERFDRRVLLPDGLAGQVKMNYMAKHQDASIKAKVNVEGIKAAFSAAAGGATAFVAKANLAATLEKAVSESNITIVSEGAKTETLDNIQEKIIENVLKGFATAPEMGKEKGEKSCSESPSQDKISVCAVLDVISKRVNSNFSYESISVEVASSFAQIEVKSSGVEDPNIVQVAIRSRYQDPTAFFVKAGQSFTIMPARWWMETLKYNDYVTLLTESDIVDLRLREHFDDLKTPGMSVRNSVDPDQPPVAIGQYTYLHNLRTGINSKGMKLPFQYVWRKTQKLPDRTPGPKTRIHLTRENMKDLRVGVSFSRVGSGKVYSLDELLNPNPYFIGSFDEVSGRIKITARTLDLGNVEFRELTGFAKEKIEKPGDVIEHKYEKMNMLTVEEVRLPMPPLSERVIKSVVLEHDEDAITLQKVLLINLTRPETEKAFMLETETAVPKQDQPKQP